jgi:cold shock CspA family protein
MTEAMEYGSHTGRVIRFFNRKGYGFVRDLNDDTEYFVHNSEIRVKEGIYRKLYPGEYVSYNLVEHEGKQTCSSVRGIMGYPLLVENEEHTFRVYPKQEYREWSTSYGHDDSSESNTDSSEDNDEPEPEKEVINKEAPPGIEVAEFDGLNINEEMG